VELQTRAEKKSDSVFLFTQRVPDQVFYDDQRSLQPFYYCEYQLNYTRSQQLNKLVTPNEEEGIEANPLTFRLQVLRYQQQKGAYEDRLEVVLVSNSSSGELTSTTYEDAQLKNQSDKVQDDGRFLSSFEISLGEEELVNLREVRLRTQNLNLQSQSTFEILVVEDYERDEDAGSAISP